MNRLLGIACALTFLVSLPFASPASSPSSLAPAYSTNARATVILGATLIDGSGGPPLTDAVVLISGERIVSVGKRSTIAIPSGARIVDATGKWLIPGLIDMHVHLDEVITPEMFVQFGVTTVRDVGSRLITVQQWRAMQDAGKSIPRIFWMGRNIDEGKPSWWGAVAVKSTAEVPALIENMALQGVDGVKLYVNAGPRVTAAVIHEAHLRGWPVTAHLNNTMPSQAAEAGIDNLEHVSQLFIELKPKGSRAAEAGFGSGYTGVPQVDLAGARTKKLISTLAAHHVAITPTLTVSLMPAIGESGSKPYYAGWWPVPPQWEREWSRNYWSFLTPKKGSATKYKTAAAAYRKYREMVGRLYRAGVPLIAGTDTPAPWVLPGAGLLVELQLMVEAGVPSSEVIHAATGRAAEVLHHTDDVGEIVPGRVADMVLLNADPIKDIRNLRKIDAVYWGGVKVRP